MSIDHMISAASGVIEAPDLWQRRLPASLAARAPVLEEADGGLRWRVGDAAGKPLGLAAALRNPHGDAAARLGLDDVAWLATADGRRWVQDRDQTAAEMLYSVGDVWGLIEATEDAAFIAACTRAYNEWLGELCAADPDRLVGIARIPASGIDDAVAELRRVGDTPGLRGVVLDAWPAGRDTPPAVRECDGFWEMAAALRLPVSLYGTLGEQPPAETAIGAGKVPDIFQDMTSIIYANIPDRFPDIRFVSAAPTAGWAPPAFEALNESYMRTSAMRKVNLGDPDLYPSDYLRRYFWFVTQEDRVALHNRDYFGGAHMMWGSFAFLGDRSAWPNSRELFEQQCAGMQDEARQLLGGEVAARLYGLAGNAPFTREEVHAYQNYALI